MNLLAHIRAWRQDRRTDKVRAAQMPPPLLYDRGQITRTTAAFTPLWAMPAEMCPDEIEVPEVGLEDVFASIDCWNDYQIRKCVDDEFVRQLTELVRPLIPKELLNQ